MSQAGAALVGLAALVAATHFLWTHVVAHVDMHLIPGNCRPRVQRLVTGSPLVYLASGGVMLCVLSVEGVGLLS
ncbi:MAG: hypothetical protein JWP33_2810 [Blastococcus sp.]|jgi:hypothetical protein|nr:hypothetical protein [Blastococcus sp.]